MARILDVTTVLRVLRKKCPTPHPVKVVRRRFEHPDDYAFCSFLEEPQPHFLIELREGMGEAAEFFALIHEYAHALTWSARRNHGREFGAAYARAWSAVGA